MGLFSKLFSPKLNQKAITFDQSFINIFGKSTGFGKVTDKDLVKNFNTIPDVFAITDFVTSQIANIPVKIVNAKGEYTNNPDLTKLIKNPNYYQNWRELMKLFASYYEVLGNGYMFKMNPEGMQQVTSLFVVPSPGMQVMLDSDSKFPNFLNSIAGYKLKLSEQEYNFKPDEILHKRYVNLRFEDGSWVYGISKYIPADKITTDLKSIYDARTSIIDSRGALGVLSNESETPDEGISKNVENKLASSYGIKNGQNKFIVTTQKLSWQQIALGVAELQLIENADYDFNKLCQLNGFDPVIFSTEGSTFANKKEAVKMFVSAVLMPKINDIYQDLNEWLSGDFGGDMIVPDWSKVDELKEDRDALSKRMAEQIKHGIVTPYNAHIQLYGETDNMPEDKYFMINSLKDDEDGNQAEIIPDTD